MPNDTDVLITHSPPFGILDKPRTGHSVGCPFLRSRIAQVVPKINCFGHVHASAGQMELSGTMFVNASVVNSDYAVCHRETVIEIEARA